jgi:hypothetical protein
MVPDAEVIALDAACRPRRRAKSDELRARWRDAFRAVRAETERRAAALSPEDQIVQSMPDASPIKWHRAHTTWFFEQFVLRPHDPGYRPFDDRFAFLFNSYYVAAGRATRARARPHHPPHQRRSAAYRAHVNAAVERLIAERNQRRCPKSPHPRDRAASRSSIRS